MVSDPKGETPHPDHQHEDDFELEFVAEPEGAAPAAAPHSYQHETTEEPHSTDPLNINASTEEFHFSGPVEELDFTEPADFTFPTEAAAEAGPLADSSAEVPGAEHAGFDHLFGTDEAVPHEMPAGEEAVAETVSAAEPEAEGAEEPAIKPKRELPAWVHKVEWTTVAALSVAAVIGLIVAAFALDSADMATLIVNICCPLMLALVAYALWRSSRRWTTPAVSALYTVLLALSAAALIGGTWVEGMELAGYQWQCGKSRVAASKPRQNFVPPAPPQK
jgi:hypothetical protein